MLIFFASVFWFLSSNEDPFHYEKSLVKSEFESKIIKKYSPRVGHYIIKLENNLLLSFPPISPKNIYDASDIGFVIRKQAHSDTLLLFNQDSLIGEFPIVVFMSSKAKQELNSQKSMKNSAVE